MSKGLSEVCVLTIGVCTYQECVLTRVLGKQVIWYVRCTINRSVMVYCISNVNYETTDIHTHG